MKKITCIVCLSIQLMYAQNNWQRIGNGVHSSGYIRLAEVKNKLYVYGCILDNYYGDTLCGIGQVNFDKIKPLPTNYKCQINQCFGIYNINDSIFLSKPYQDEVTGNILTDNLYYNEQDLTFTPYYHLFNGPTHFMVKTINGVQYFTGLFTKVKNLTTKNFVSYDGYQWKSLYNDTIYTDVGNFADYEFYKGKFYVGGYYAVDYPTGSIYCLATLDNGILYPIPGWNPASLYNEVLKLVVYKDELYIGGSFIQANGAPYNYLMKYNGTDFTMVGAGVDYPVTDMLVYNNSLYVAGAFNTAGGIASPRIARWDGENWHSLGNSNFGNYTYIKDMHIFQDELYISGVFTTIDGDTVNNIARYAHQLPGEENELEVWYISNTNELVVNYESNHTYTLTISIINMSGQVLATYTKQDILGYSFNKFFVQVPAGVYIAQVSVADKRVNRKFVVQ